MTRLLCLLDSNGKPLLARAYGGPAPASFRTIAALMTSVTSFSRHGGFDLRRIHSEDVRVIFQSCYDELLLVLVTNDLAAPEAYLRALLEYIQHGLVLVLGAEVLTSASLQSGAGQAHLQRAFRAATPLVDHLCSDEDLSFAVALAAVRMHPGPEGAEGGRVAGALGGLAEAAGVECAAISVASCLHAATAAWWALHPTEVLLLQSLLPVLGPPALRDLPIYLPITNPATPVRLVSVLLCADVHLLMLCADEPSLSRAAELAKQHLGGVRAVLQAAARQARWPSSVPVPPQVRACMYLRTAAAQLWMHPCAASATLPAAPAASPLAAAQDPAQANAANRALVALARIAMPLRWLQPQASGGRVGEDSAGGAAASHAWEAPQTHEYDLPQGSTPKQVQLVVGELRAVAVLGACDQVLVALPASTTAAAALQIAEDLARAAARVFTSAVPS